MNYSLTPEEKKAWLDYKKSFESEPVLDEDWREKAYSAKEQLVNAFVEYDPDFTLVAHGKVKDDKCGVFMHRKVKKLKGCLRVHLHDQIGVGIDGVDYRNKVDIRRIFYSCNRPECPSCGVSSWAVKEAGRAEQRLKFAANRYKMKIEHIVISPKQDFKGTFEELRKYVLKAMLARGIVGGMFLYHHFRYHGRDESYIGEEPHYFKGIHFHALAFIKGGYGNCRSCRYCKDGTFLKCKDGCNGFNGVTRRAFDEDGVIAEVLGERKTVGGTVWYQLSHASIKKDVKKQVVVNWFGICGRNKLRIPKGSLPQREHLCRICGEKLYDVVYEGDYAKLLAFMGGFKDGEGFLLDAKDGKPGLREFFKEKSPQSQQENLTVYAYYLKKQLKINDMQVGHVVSCAKEVKRPVPTNIPSLFNNIQHRKGWLDIGSGGGSAQITIPGENYVEYDLPRKKDASKNKAAT